MVGMVGIDGMVGMVGKEGMVGILVGMDVGMEGNGGNGSLGMTAGIVGRGITGSGGSVAFDVPGSTGCTGKTEGKGGKFVFGRLGMDGIGGSVSFGRVLGGTTGNGGALGKLGMGRTGCGGATGVWWRRREARQGWWFMESSTMNKERQGRTLLDAMFEWSSKVQWRELAANVVKGVEFL